MKKLIRHSWIEREGFRVYQCEHCGVERYWNSSFQRLIFRWGKLPNGEWMYNGYMPPQCKRTFFCDAVNTNDILDILINKI